LHSIYSISNFKVVKYILTSFAHIIFNSNIWGRLTERPSNCNDTMI